MNNYCLESDRRKK